MCDYPISTIRSEQEEGIPVPELCDDEVGLLTQQIIQEPSSPVAKGSGRKGQRKQAHPKRKANMLEMERSASDVGTSSSSPKDESSEVPVISSMYSISLLLFTIFITHIYYPCIQTQSQQK